MGRLNGRLGEWASWRGGEIWGSEKVGTTMCRSFGAQGRGGGGLGPYGTELRWWRACRPWGVDLAGEWGCATRWELNGAGWGVAGAVLVAALPLAGPAAAPGISQAHAENPHIGRSPRSSSQPLPNLPPCAYNGAFLVSKKSPLMADLKDKTILIVDDDPDVVTAITMSLTDLGAKVFQAGRRRPGRGSLREGAARPRGAGHDAPQALGVPRRRAHQGSQAQGLQAAHHHDHGQPGLCATRRMPRTSAWMTTSTSRSAWSVCWRASKKFCLAPPAASAPPANPPQ